MKKVTLMGLSLFILLVARPAFAEQQEVDRYVCLQAVRCDQANANCSPENANVHRVKLTARTDVKPLPNASTYLIECVSVPNTNKQFCTTGKATSDVAVYRQDNSTGPLAQSVQYRFEGLFASDGRTVAPNPVTTNNAGEIGTLEWQSVSTTTTGHKFLAYNRYIPRDTGGQAGGQQQGTFNFEVAAKNCVTINWDPYGVVFDSQSLEPVPGTEVTLYKVDADGRTTIVSNILGGNIINPQRTTEDGGFSFVVPDDTYRVGVVTPGYQFPNIAAKLNANYTKVYSDIYRGEDIVQSGRIVHKDIPTDSDMVGGRTYRLKWSLFQETEKATGKIVIDGTVSHPLTKVTVISQKLDPTDPQGIRKIRTGEVAKVQADKKGIFSITIDPTKLTPTETLDVEFTKVDLAHGIVSRIFNFFQVFAQETSTVSLEVIPNYIEGVAYDVKNNPLPNATVGVYLTFSENPYYQVKSDSKGFFKINSANLPSMPYRLRYDSAVGNRTTIAPAQFLAQNVKYLTENKVEVNKYHDTTGKIITTASTGVSEKNSSVPFSQNKIGGNTGANQNPSATPTAQNPLLLLAVVILLLIGAAGLLFGVYWYRKTKSNLPPMT